jgi:hypothetical protein
LSRLQGSGTISLNDVRNQFGASGSPDMAEYYRGGVNASRVHSYGSGHNTSVPTSGTISLANFYNTHRGWHLVCGQVNLQGIATNYGYSNGVIIPAMGSINPGNYRGATIMSMYRVRTTFKGTRHSMVIYMQGGLARNHFNRYTDGNITVYTANASYFVGTRNGVYCTSWIWGSNYVANLGSYSNGAVLSPETPQ